MPNPAELKSDKEEIWCVDNYPSLKPTGSESRIVINIDEVLGLGYKCNRIILLSYVS